MPRAWRPRGARRRPRSLTRAPPRCSSLLRRKRRRRVSLAVAWAARDHMIGKRVRLAALCAVLGACVRRARGAAAVKVGEGVGAAFAARRVPSSPRPAPAPAPAPCAGQASAARRLWAVASADAAPSNWAARSGAARRHGVRSVRSQWRGASRVMVSTPACARTAWLTGRRYTHSRHPSCSAADAARVLLPQQCSASHVTALTCIFLINMHVEVNIDQICVFQRPQDLTSKVPGSENHRHGHRDVTVATAAASHGGARRRRGQCDSDSDQFKLGVPRAGQGGRAAARARAASRRDSESTHG